MNQKLTALLPLLFSILFYSSCFQSGTSKVLDKEKQYDIHLVKARMVFPDFYRATTFEQLSHEMDLADNLEVADTARKRRIKELLSGTNYFLLADTTDPYSIISIFLSIMFCWTG